jgi:PadR family transcriptional regulator PadR
MKERRDPILTRQTMTVLSALLDSAESLAGSNIASATGLASGTLYPILIRLEAAKWIKSEWETVDLTTKETPRRRLYSMTPLGTKRSREEARAWKPLVERFA